MLGRCCHALISVTTTARPPVTEALRRPPGADLLLGAVDGHIHACPHINARRLDVFEAVRDAASAGMRAIGLMDNFANSSGMAALVRRELGSLDVEVFGGLIMEPPAGGVSAACVKNALAYGYAPEDGARFVSFPTHHTRYTARLEQRSETYQATCFSVPESGAPDDDVLAILDLVAAADVVLNTGHLSAPESVRLVEHARERGVERILVPANYFDEDAAREVISLGAFAEFSFFFVSHATEAGLTHVDAERHTIPRVEPARMATLVRALDPAKVVLSSDCGVFLLPPPIEGLREFLLLLASAGVPEVSLRRMVTDNPIALYGLDMA